MQKLSFVTQDGYLLSGRLYRKAVTSDKLPILIGAATGIKQGFYQPFAQWLAAQGHDVMTFDFRGIGDSLYGRVSDSTASISQWGQFDLPAALQTLLAQSRATRAILVGHSAGGQLLGLMPNHAQVARIIAIAGSSGRLSGLAGRTRWLAPVMFYGIFPVSTLIKGYAATKSLGMGENLPKQVGAQWRDFCRRGGYAINASRRGVPSYHEQITTPIIAFHASDDEIATLANVQDFLNTFSSHTECITVQPADYGYRSIGHMALLRPSHDRLWPLFYQHIQPDT